MEKLLELKEFLFGKKYYVIGGIIFLLLLGCSIYFCYQKSNDNESEEIVFFEEESEAVVEETEECYVNVDIKGEVNNPGLYYVICDSRVQDVINEAGGITDKADTSILNLGKKVSDEMVIIVYSEKEVENFTITKEEETKKIESCTNINTIKNDACIEQEDLNVTNNIQNDSSTDEVIGDTPVNVLVSINKATKEELMTLSGIGESKANNIISYRTENGGFKSIDEIKYVKGIGDSIFDKIKDNITL